METKNNLIKNEVSANFDFLDALTLSQLELQEVKFFVEDFLCQGLTILASKPKCGKSWLSLDLCLQVAKGYNFLSKETVKSDVLYLALEDSKNRLKSRMTKILDGSEAPDNLYLSTSCKRLDNGLIADLESFLIAKPNTKLIVIDTFAKIRGSANKGETLYQFDSREASYLKLIADKHNIAILLVTHTSKLERESSVESINGTNGLSGIADSIFVMKRADNSKQATLSTTGRDIESSDIEIIFNENTCRWQLLGKSQDMAEELNFRKYCENKLVKAIKILLAENGGKCRVTVKNIIDTANQNGMQITETTQKIGKVLPSIIEDLYKYEHISYTAIQNGTGAKYHEFSIK